MSPEQPSPSPHPQPVPVPSPGQRPHMLLAARLSPEAAWSHQLAPACPPSLNGIALNRQGVEHHCPWSSDPNSYLSPLPQERLLLNTPGP